MELQIITYQFITKEERDLFLAEAKKNKIEECSQNEIGCLRYEYVIKTDNDLSLYLIEAWENEEVKKPHHQMPHFILAMELKKKYRCVSSKREKFIIQQI
jgi:quinol monooxygenase YgiN